MTLAIDLRTTRVQTIKENDEGIDRTNHNGKQTKSNKVKQTDKQRQTNRQTDKQRQTNKQSQTNK